MRRKSAYLRPSGMHVPSVDMRELVLMVAFRRDHHTLKVCMQDCLTVGILLAIYRALEDVATRRILRTTQQATLCSLISHTRK